MLRPASGQLREGLGVTTPTKYPRLARTATKGGVWGSTKPGHAPPVADGWPGDGPAFLANLQLPTGVHRPYRVPDQDRAGQASTRRLLPHGSRLCRRALEPRSAAAHRWPGPPATSPEQRSKREPCHGQITMSPSRFPSASGPPMCEQTAEKRGFQSRPPTALRVGAVRARGAFRESSPAVLAVAEVHASPF